MAGYRGLLAPWIGGAATKIDRAGYRGLLAPWLGGASARTVAVPSYRSLLAFWMGGASAIAGIVPPIPPTPEPTIEGGVPGKPRSFRFPASRRLREDEEIMVIICAAFQIMQP